MKCMKITGKYCSGAAVMTSLVVMVMISAVKGLLEKFFAPVDSLAQTDFLTA